MPRGMIGPPTGLWIVVTCMGRRAFLEQTIASVRAPGDPAAPGYCLVDFSCPDRAGDWLEATYRDDVRAGTMVVVRVEGREFFHKTAALNQGARAAIDRGARHLCFADADTMFAPGACAEIGARIGDGRFLIASGDAATGASVPSLTGLAVVGSDAFMEAGGYDETFEDWGSEDVELRLRLHLRLGLEAVSLPPGLVWPLRHGNWTRSRFHRERDLRKSGSRNYSLLQERVRQWTGQPLENLPESAKRLLFVAR
jgi:hypothetical protein